MGMSSFNCLVCGRDMMSDLSYKDTPDWMKHVVVFMPDDVMIAGKYSGYQAVETGETIWSRFVDRKRHEKFDRCEGISIIQFKSDMFFDKEKCDADRGYLDMHMWEDGHLHNPCCYHRDCWEAVGSPMGYRASSIRSHDQGFGGNNSLFCSGGFDGIDDDDEPWAPPDPGDIAMQWWAVNSICHFLYTVNSWAGAVKFANEKRDMWKSIDEMKELLDRTDDLIEEHDDKEDPDNGGSGLRTD